MSKWYVVGKIGGFIGSLKTIALLGAGFVGGCLLMDGKPSKHVPYPTPDYRAYRRSNWRYSEDPVFNEGWRAGYRCGLDVARGERDEDNDDE